MAHPAIDLVIALRDTAARLKKGAHYANMLEDKLLQQVALPASLFEEASFV
ncbi:MAG TPA: hypothetical protein VHB48_13630 [Chitinophagaceae bacterium]|nr:hypothetical protein [Chitinophagaceae bacterium]